MLFFGIGYKLTDPINRCPHGLIGPKCEFICESNFYGLACKENCDCRDEGTSGPCDATTGICRCKSGWTGKQCELTCEQGFWGHNCLNSCKDNCDLPLCDPVTGMCLT